MGEVVEGLAGGAVAVADGVLGPEVGPVGFPGLGVEAAVGGDTAEEGEGLVTVVGEVAGAFAGVVFGMGGVVAGETGAVDAGDFGGVVDPVGAEAEGVGGEGGDEEVGDELGHGGEGDCRMRLRQESDGASFFGCHLRAAQQSRGPPLWRSSTCFNPNPKDHGTPSYFVHRPVGRFVV